MVCIRLVKRVLYLVDVSGITVGSLGTPVPPSQERLNQVSPSSGSVNDVFFRS